MVQIIDKLTNAEKVFILAGFVMAIFWSDLNKTFIVTLKIPLLGGLGCTYVLVGIHLIQQRIVGDGQKIADSIIRSSIDDLEDKIVKRLENEKNENYSQSGS
jgi:hypothetical protein